jgi:hypothetical protein
MLRYMIVSLASGILFGILDGIINANPLAQKLYAVYQPIARTSVNAIAGVAIDLVYGFVLAAVFLILYASLPGQHAIVKGLAFAIIVWFFRVVMQAASTWMMFNVPIPTIIYSLVAGLAEMLVLGLLYGLTLRPISLH